MRRKTKTVIHKIPVAVYYLLIPLILTVILVTLVFMNVAVKKYIYTNSLFYLPLSFTTYSSYPLVLNPDFPVVTAKAVIILDDDSKIILFEKNAHLRFSMASTTKLMTALTALDFYKPDDILTIKSSLTEGAVVGFPLGQKIYFKDMLYAMLLPSGNDAAQAIAQNYPGGEEEFIKKMNEKAKALNLFNTNFSDSTGLDDSGDYTTAFELARLAAYAVSNPIIREIVGTKETVITDVSNSTTYSLKNLNKLLGQDGVNGIKTGFTKEAGEVLITSKMENNHKIIVVVMNSLDRFLDSKQLVSFLSGNIYYKSFSPN